MKVLLVRPRPTMLQNTRVPESLAHEIGYVMPLGIAYIGAYLRKNGVPVSIIDAEAEELSQTELIKRMTQAKPDIVGITTMTPTVHDDMAVARIARQLGAKVVAGGPQVNAMPEETIRAFPVDYGVYGEGEYPMFRLVEALDKSLPLNNIPGLIYKGENNKIIVNPTYIHHDLDQLPMPAIDLLPYERYHSIITKGRLATVCIGRGCPYQCAFCFKQPSDSKIRFRDPKSVVAEIELNVRKYGVREINFVSDSLTVKKSFIEELCNELLKSEVRVSWIAATRADCITPALLRLMKRAGCRSLRFGVESGSDRILKLMDKNLDKEKMVQAFRWAKQERIETFAYLIIGYLQETEDTVKETLSFVKKLKPDLLMYNIATPLPATRLFDQAVKAGLVPREYWNNFLLDADYPRIPYLFADTDKWIQRAYQSFFFSPRFLCKKALLVRPENIKSYFKAFKGIWRM